jgi:hypothetical protein
MAIMGWCELLRTQSDHVMQNRLELLMACPRSVNPIMALNDHDCLGLLEAGTIPWSLWTSFSDILCSGRGLGWCWMPTRSPAGCLGSGDQCFRRQDTSLPLY